MEDLLKLTKELNNPEFNQFIIDHVYKPAEVHLEQHSGCNARCIMCPRGGMQRYKGPMDSIIFYKCINDLVASPPEILHFHLNGEPLLLEHKELVNRINFSKNKLRTSRMMFFTNAALLTEEVSKALITESSLDEICFSVDGGTKEDYEKIRVGLNFDVVVKNIETFQNLNSQLSIIGRKIKTHAFIVPQRDNKGSIDRFMALFNGMGIDDVGGSGIQNIGGLVDGDALRTDLQYMKGDIESPCWRIFLDIDVMADGNVPICCQDVRGDHIIGNVMEQNLLDIWQKNFNPVRIKFIQGKKAEISHCADCDFMRSFVEPPWWPKVSHDTKS